MKKQNEKTKEFVVKVQDGARKISWRIKATEKTFPRMKRNFLARYAILGFDGLLEELEKERKFVRKGRK